jgi:hypothetical protein
MLREFVYQVLNHGGVKLSPSLLGESEVFQNVVRQVREFREFDVRDGSPVPFFGVDYRTPFDGAGLPTGEGNDDLDAFGGAIRHELVISGCCGYVKG